MTGSIVQASGGADGLALASSMVPSAVLPDAGPVPVVCGLPVEPGLAGGAVGAAEAGVIYGRGDHMLDHLSHAFHTFPIVGLVGLRSRPVRPVARYVAHGGE